MSLKPAVAFLAALAIGGCGSPVKASDTSACRFPVLVDDGEPARPVFGAEDIAIDRTGGLVLVSATHRWRLEHDDEGDTENDDAAAPDGIYLLDPQSIASGDRIVARRLPLEGVVAGHRFHPHGIDLYRGGDGALRLFVVNHSGPGTGWRRHSIEIYDVDVAAGVLRQAGPPVRDPLLTNPNDLAAIGPAEALVTNLSGAATAAGEFLGGLFPVNQGNVVAVRAGAAPPVRMAVPDLWMANGIAVTQEPDRADRHVIIVESRREAVAVVGLADATGGAAPAIRRAEIGIGGDNLTWGPDGSLYLAGHPDPMRFVLYAKQWFGTDTSPSRVLRFGARDVAALLAGDAPRPEVAFDDDGARLSASSVGAVVGNRLLVGTVFSDRLAVCPLGQP